MELDNLGAGIPEPKKQDPVPTTDQLIESQKAALLLGNLGALPVELITKNFGNDNRLGNPIKEKRRAKGKASNQEKHQRSE